MDYQKLCKASLFKGRVEGKEKERLKKSLDFLGLDVTPEETAGLANTVGVIGMCTSLLVIAVLTLFLGFSIFWILFPVFSVVLNLYLRRYPMLKAESEKRKSLGQMPEVVSYLIMSLRINPNIEKAIEFSSAHSRGLFKRRLDGILSAIESGTGDAESGLLRLAEDFKKWNELERSIRLVISSVLEKTEEKRQRTLDKAAEVLLDGIAIRTEREARGLNTPVMIVFTFGVILPLVFIAIIPFMSLMGIELGAMTILLMYDIVLPVLLVVMINFIASNRPITIPAPQIPAEKTKKAWVPAAVIGSAAMVPALAGGALGAMRYLPVLWGLGTGIGALLLIITYSVKRKRKVIKELEASFGETLHQLGVVLAEGRPLEDAMGHVEADFLKVAVGNIDTLGTDLRSAFFNKDYGSLRDTHSATIRGVIDILTSVADKGSEAISNVSFRMSEHINNLKKSEAEIERALGGVVSSMKIIASVVAPLVGGLIASMSVVLADTAAESQKASMGFGSGNAIDPALITFIIGLYVMESAAVLTLFGADLMHGGDNVVRKYSIGLALPVSIAVFTICAWFANVLFGGIA